MWSEGSVIDVLEILTLNEACEILKSNGMKAYPEKIGAGLQQGVFPFGTAIKLKEWTYEIYKPLLDAWIRERSKKGEETCVKDNT